MKESKHVISLLKARGEKSKRCQKRTIWDRKVRCILWVIVYEMYALRRYDSVWLHKKSGGQKGLRGCLACLQLSAAASTRQLRGRSWRCPYAWVFTNLWRLNPSSLGKGKISYSHRCFIIYKTVRSLLKGVSWQHEKWLLDVDVFSENMVWLTLCWAQDTSLLGCMTSVITRLQAGCPTVHWLTAEPYAFKHTLYFQSCSKCALLGQSDFSR